MTEITLANPVPCKVDGRPALIVGYGSHDGWGAVDYRFEGETTLHWCSAGASRITDVAEQHDWHVDYHYRKWCVYGCDKAISR